MQLYFPNEPVYFTPPTFDDLLIHCCNHGASDITIQTDHAVMIEAHGKLHRATKRDLTPQEISDIANYIYGANAVSKIFSGTDVDSSYETKDPIKKTKQRYRVNMTACQTNGHKGMQITLRTIPDVPPKLETMNLDQELINSLSIPQGLFIVSGATGSGKSTLMASLIRSLVESPESHLKILTYESPIEYVYDDVHGENAIVSQTEIPRYLPNFASGVRNALRRKPGLILVGEARDYETISSVMEASLTGHPVYTTVHSNGVADTFRRMVTLFPHMERDSRYYDLVQSTKIIIWQALVIGVDGKRLPVREHLIFSNDVKKEMLSSSVNDIYATINQLLIKQGSDIKTQARKLLDAGKICQTTYERFS
ncbi:Flp pilus assembly complex ATPase component TadA [Thiotrichales bacterium 19S9-12]|nr:Flp pilus assembly complex ATPase component TadA [Thiotrichales bacterium 19S9-11]MCF6811259.1 Flp pilus assembly complex ATPase component TadA [Thiotrichales bacterium 19S9-12]